MIDLGQYHIGGTTAIEIAESAESAIRRGGLENGQTLPTVRSLAGALGTSPATVQAAYRILRERGLIITDGRRGTRIARHPPLRRPAPSRPLPYSALADPGKHDVAMGLPDPQLLPPLADALARVDVTKRISMTSLDRNDPELISLAAHAFAADDIVADHVAVTAGAFDALERLLRAHLRTGDRVLVEDPVYSSIPDLVLSLGLVPVPVAIDDLGLAPAALRRALTHGVRAAVIIPRAQNPFGAAHDRERAEELCGIFASHREVLLIEDDHAGEIAGARMHTLSGPGLEHWAVVRSASKTLHPDLRVAVVAGDETTIARVEGQQMLGARWVSHILQAVVVELLRDPGFDLVTQRARETHTRRREALLEALAVRGIAAHGRSGLNVWVPVAEEAPVIRALDEAGWIALAGEPFRLEAPPGIRVTTATLPQASAEEVADVIAAAASVARPRRQY